MTLESQILFDNVCCDQTVSYFQAEAQLSHAENNGLRQQSETLREKSEAQRAQLQVALDGLPINRKAAFFRFFSW